MQFVERPQHRHCVFEPVTPVKPEIVRQQRQAKEMERVSASVTAYYDSISDEERAENLAWGGFAESQFPRDGES